MDPAAPASSGQHASTHRPRSRHRWLFERLESRTLLSGVPVIATSDGPASARPIGGDVANGPVEPGSQSLSRLDATGDRQLAAVVGGSSFGGGIAWAVPIKKSSPIILGMILHAADFTGDGQLDLADAGGISFGGGIAVVMGVGDGTLGPPSMYLAGAPVISLAADDIDGDGRLDVIVANPGDGSLALFLGGLDDSPLLGSRDTPAAPGPASRAPDSPSGSLLDFYSGMEGEEVAFRLAFDLDDDGGGRRCGVGPDESRSSPSGSAPPSPTPIQQVAFLQPLGDASSLAIVATLMTGNVGEGEVVLAVPDQPVGVGGGEGDPEGADDEDDEPTSPILIPGTISPQLRFLYGLDGAHDRARREASMAHRRAGVAEREAQSPDAVLDRGSPIRRAPDGPSPTGNVIDAAVLAASSDDDKP